MENNNFCLICGLTFAQSHARAVICYPCHQRLWADRFHPDHIKVACEHWHPLAAEVYCEDSGHTRKNVCSCNDKTV